MRHRLSLILTLAAWLLATGSHWDLVQTYAWGRMIADYARVMPLSAAVTKAFSSETMCDLCHAVADAKQQQAGDPAVPAAKSPGKILLVCAPSTRVFVSPALIFAGLLYPASAPLSAERAAPPRPPPRTLA